MVRPGRDPVVVNSAALNVGLGEQVHHLLCDWVNQVAGRAGQLIWGSIQLRIAGAGVGGHVVEWDEGRGYAAAEVGIVGIGIGVPNLTLWVGTLAGGVKRSAIGGAYLAKVPGAFGGAWDTGLRRGRRGFAGTVPIEEEEGLILEDRTADGAAIVIAAERWDGLPIMIGKPAIGIENLVADKVVAFAMKDVGPGLRDHVDDRTAGESILGAEVGLLDF